MIVFNRLSSWIEIHQSGVIIHGRMAYVALSMVATYYVSDQKKYLSVKEWLCLFD